MLEFKQGVSEHTIAEAVTAFSNTGGGTVLVGVDPRGRPVGTNTDGEAEARIHRVVARVHRPGRYTLHVLDAENVKGLTIAVSRRQGGYAQTADGRVLMRRGAMNVAGTTYLLTAPTEARGKASIEVFHYRQDGSGSNRRKITGPLQHQGSQATATVTEWWGWRARRRPGLRGLGPCPDPRLPRPG